MAKVVTNQCKQTIIDRYAGIGGPPAALQSMSMDDSTTLLTTTTTTLGSPTNLFVDDFDSASRSAQTLTVTATAGTANANYMHRRLVTHNAAAASVTGTSVTVQYGHDQQTINKNSSTAVTYSMELVLT